MLYMLKAYNYIKAAEGNMGKKKTVFLWCTNSSRMPDLMWLCVLAHARERVQGFACNLKTSEETSNKGYFG